MKPQATRLVIKKIPFNEYDQWTEYIYDWYNQDQLIMSEKRMVDIVDGVPVPSASTQELIDHKIECCLDINRENFQVEEL